MKSAHLLTDEQRAREMRASAACAQRALRQGMPDAQSQNAFHWDLLRLTNAADGLSAATKARYPGVRWDDVKGARNHLAHDHPVINAAVMRLAATTLVPQLEEVARLEMARTAALRTGERAPSRSARRAAPQLDLGL